MMVKRGVRSIGLKPSLSVADSKRGDATNSMRATVRHPFPPCVVQCLPNYHRDDGVKAIYRVDEIIFVCAFSPLGDHPCDG
jgi:hypothetical protein